MTLKDYTEHFYLDKNYNCAEAMLHACNAFYDLGIDEAFMKSMGGFGSGMFSGLNCGALVGCNAALSIMLVKDKAHDELDVIRPATTTLVRNFRNFAQGVGCPELKPKHNTKETRCLNTCLLAEEAMEKTMKGLNIERVDGSYQIKKA